MSAHTQQLSLGRRTHVHSIGLWGFLMWILSLSPMVVHGASVTAAQSSGEFNEWFPGFVQACVSLHDAFMPVSLLLLVLSFGFFFWQIPTHGPDIVRFLVKLVLIVLLISNAHVLINDTQSLIQEFVQQHVPARPENIAERYQAKLAEAQNAPEIQEQSFTSLLFSSNFFEAIVLAVMTLISWLAMAVLFFVFVVQKGALLLCWTLSPVLFALFAIPPFAYIAFRHLMRIIGILLWPIGLSLAATITDGLIDNQIRAEFLSEFKVGGVSGWGLQQILALTVIAIWVLFSSVVVPVATQRFVAGGSGSGSVLTKSADLLANVGIPLTSLIFSGERTSNQSRQAGSGRHASAQSPIPAMPMDSPSPPPTHLVSQFAPGPEDPTGQTRVDEILAGQAEPKEPI